MKYELVETVALPQYAVTYIEYGEEEEELATSDKAKIDAWLKTMPRDVYFEYGADPYFTNYPVFGKPCVCITTDIYVLAN